MASAALTSKRWRSLICVLGLYVFVTIETFAAILGIIRLIGVRRHRHFEVIAKPL
jgi:threonine/homoserine/homoserine lactone efflux protein